MSEIPDHLRRALERTMKDVTASPSFGQMQTDRERLEASLREEPMGEVVEGSPETPKPLHD